MAAAPHPDRDPGTEAEPSTDGGADREPGPLRRARRAGRLLDAAVRIPGTGYRVGFDPVLSLLPGGTILGGLVGLYIVAEAARYGVPARVLVRMVANLALDAAGGAVPLIGPVVDAVWRANQRNVALFERHVEREVREAAFVGIDID
jgi:hypothetical protein